MITYEKLEPIVARALEAFFVHERTLLIVDANERSITHKLAEHLCRAMPSQLGLDIDCEYNRQGLDPKRLNTYPPVNAGYPNQASTEDDKGTTVYPDIIVHRRREKENLLVIEVKKSTNPAEHDRDLHKLREFVLHPDYEYDFGLFLSISTGRHAKREIRASAIWLCCEDHVAKVLKKGVYRIPK